MIIGVVALLLLYFVGVDLVEGYRVIEGNIDLGIKRQIKEWKRQWKLNVKNATTGNNITTGNTIVYPLQ